MKLFHLFAGATLAAASAGCAMNGVDEGVVGDQFSNRACSNFGMIDRNNNTILDRNEWGMFRTGVFTDWDRNKDRRISSAEFQDCWRANGFMNVGFREDWGDDNFGAFDDDNDGFLGPNEFFGDDEFGMFDRDGDFGIELGLGEWGF